MIGWRGRLGQSGEGSGNLEMPDDRLERQDGMETGQDRLERNRTS